MGERVGDGVITALTLFRFKDIFCVRSCIIMRIAKTHSLSVPHLAHGIHVLEASFFLLHCNRL